MRVQEDIEVASRQRLKELQSHIGGLFAAVADEHAALSRQHAQALERCADHAPQCNVCRVGDKGIDVAQVQRQFGRNLRCCGDHGHDRHSQARDFRRLGIRAADSSKEHRDGCSDVAEVRLDSAGDRIVTSSLQAKQSEALV